MALFSRSRRSTLETRIDDLHDEIASLTRALSRRGESALREGRREATDLYGEMAQAISSALPVIGRRSKVLERQVRDNPATAAAAAGVLVVGIAALIWLGRR